jgi:hypothetical protein
MWITIRVEKFIENIESSLRAIQEALGDETAHSEQRHTTNQQDQEDQWRGRVARAFTEREIQKRVERKKDSQTQKSLNHQFWLNALTLFAVLGAWIYAGIAAVQAYEMKKATEATRQAVRVARDTLAETQRSNLMQEGQNKKTLQASIDNFRQEQRAWIAVTSVHGTTPENSDSFEIAVDITNTGLTPAYNVVVYDTFSFAEQNVPIPFNVEVPPRNLGLLSPKGDRTIDWRKKDTFPNATPAFFKERRAHIFGRIIYDDQAGHHHWITYCATSSDDWNKYNFCDSHNDADPD